MTVNSGQAKVLIVGAGAMGLTLGYELQRAGAEITFLVRPARAPDLAKPQSLYSYDDASLKTFVGFAVIVAGTRVGAASTSLGRPQHTAVSDTEGGLLSSSCIQDDRGGQGARFGAGLRRGSGEWRTDRALRLRQPIHDVCRGPTMRRLGPWRPLQAGAARRTPNAARGVTREHRLGRKTEPSRPGSWF